MNQEHRTITPNNGTLRCLLCMVAVFVACAFFPLNAMADLNTAVSNVLAQGLLIVPSLGTLALIVLGIAAMFGRISMTQALVIAIGIVIATNTGDLYTSIAR